MTTYYAGLDELQLRTELTTTASMPDSHFANLMLDLLDDAGIDGRLRPRPSRYSPYQIELAEADLTLRSVQKATWEIDTYVHQEPLQRDPTGTYSVVWQAVLGVPRGCVEVETASLSTTSLTVCVDFTGGPFGRSSMAKIRTSSRIKPKETPTGFHFGKALVAYNKSVDMRENRSKTYLKAIRQAQGWNEERDGDLQRIEFQHKGKALLSTPYPDLAGLILHDLDRFELTRKAYGRAGRRETAPLWKRLRAQVPAKTVVPWEEAPPVHRVRHDDARVLHAKLGMNRHTNAWLAARLLDDAKSAKDIFDAVRERHFPPGSPGEEELLREFRIQRGRRGC